MSRYRAFPSSPPRSKVETAEEREVDSMEAKGKVRKGRERWVNLWLMTELSSIKIRVNKSYISLNKITKFSA